MDNVAGQMNSSTVDQRQDRSHPCGATAHLFSLPRWHLPPELRFGTRLIA